MLEEVLRYLNNWFVVPGGVHTGTFTVENGGIVLPFLQNGQYFRVTGSVFNDGLHQYPIGDLTDEAFDGTIWALAVPKVVISLSEEISTWNEKNGAAGPYSSESFGGYSYTRATKSNGQAVGWQDVFAARLSPWKKPAGSWQFAQPNPHMMPPEPHEGNPWR